MILNQTSLVHRCGMISILLSVLSIVDCGHLLYVQCYLILMSISQLKFYVRTRVFFTIKMSQNIQNKITNFFTSVPSSKCLDSSSTSTSYNNDIESYNNCITLKRKHEDVDQLESDTIQNNVSIYYTVHTHM